MVTATRIIPRDLTPKFSEIPTEHCCEEHLIPMLRVQQGSVFGQPFCPVCRAVEQRETMESL